MTKLTDTQAILLTNAAGVTGGSLLLAPRSVTAPADRVRKAIASLVRRGLAAEAPVSLPAGALRSEGDIHIGALITHAGRAATGLIDGEQEQPAAEQSAAVITERETKAGSVIGLLKREQGATLTELVAVTRWLPHTTRAALTGLRKKGHTIEKSKRHNETCYRIVVAA